MNRRWLIALGLLVTVISLYIAFRGIHYQELFDVFGTIDYIWTIPIVGSTLLSIWIRSYRWKFMLEPIKKVATSEAYCATMIGFMANNVLPMRLGELVRAYSIGRTAGVSKSTAFATIVVERAFDLLALLLFLAVMLLRYSLAPWVQAAGYVALAICLVMFVVMMLFRWKRHWLLSIIAFFIRPLPPALREKVNGLVSRFLDGLEVLSRGHHLLWIAFLSLLTWVAMAGSFFFTNVAFDLAIPPHSSIVMVVVCALAVMLPSGPGFVGTFEVGAKYGLLLFGVSESVALSYALYYHAVQFLPLTLLGLYHLWRQNFSLRRAMEDDGEGA